MPAYGMPGVAVDRRATRILGLLTVAVAALVAVGVRLTPSGGEADTITVTLLTEKIGAGIDSGAAVRLDGVRVGRIEAIEPARSGQRITVRLDKTQLFGLTDALSLDYAPGNLFGIGEVQLHPGEGGSMLRDAETVDLTGDRARRTTDATMSRLLGSVGRLTNDVLTPQLTSVLNQIATDTRAFTPLLQAIIVTLQGYTETRQVPADYLLTQWGSTLDGLPATTQGICDLLAGPFDNRYLVQPGKVAKFDATLDMISNQLLGAVTQTLDAGTAHYSGYTGILAPTLAALANTVPTPGNSAADLRALLERVGAAMPDTPDGPVLHLAVDLRGVPALAVPLSALLAGGGR